MWKFTYTQSERKQVQSHEVWLKLRVSEGRGKVYFYYAEREQVQAHIVWLKRKTENGKVHM